MDILDLIDKTSAVNEAFLFEVFLKTAFKTPFFNFPLLILPYFL